MKRSMFLALALGSLILTACSTSDSAMVDDEASSASSSVEAMMPASSSSEGAMMEDARVVRIEASNWEFTPSTVSAKVGEKVKLEFVGVDGNHGVAVADLGIDVNFDEGETATVDLPTDTAGTFPFRCNVFCGEGHREMTGTIVIE